MLQVCYDNPMYGEIDVLETVADRSAADRLVELLLRFGGNFERSRFIVRPAE
jgi:hypothetical protein